MLKAAESRKKTTSDRLKLLEGIPGIARSELDLLRAEVERSTSDVEIRAAELKEHEVRIAITRRQASRTIPNTSKPEEKDPLRDLVEALAKAQLQRDQELQAEKKRLAEEKKAQEQARIDQQKQQQLIELESRRAAEKTELENRLRHLNTELDQLGSKIKLMETKIAQVELEKRALLVQSEEMMAHKTRLEALKKEIEQQLKREPR
jgi:chromosome segregation ATPase